MSIFINILIMFEEENILDRRGFVLQSVATNIRSIAGFFYITIKFCMEERVILVFD